MKIAIIGAGISGLGCAWRLMKKKPAHWQINLFEKNNYFGGHSNTVDITLDQITYGVDTGFLVFNHRTYPRLKELFESLNVETAASDMSFSVMSEQSSGHTLEWAGSNLNTVFAQRCNLVSPRFLRMLLDIMRFNHEATAYAQQFKDEHVPLGEYLKSNGYGAAFRDDYLLPMAGCIWSCPPEKMLEFPMFTFARFCNNHGLLQVRDRPQWYTVKGGSKHYVQKLRSTLEVQGARFQASCPVTSVIRNTSTVEIKTHDDQTLIFDAVVMATHSDEALKLLSEASEDEKQLLAGIRYQPNVAVLHTDEQVLPRRRLAWSSWNYVRTSKNHETAVSVNYLLNRLQPLPFEQPIIVSLNPVQKIRPDRVIKILHYAHPVLDGAAVQAQQQLPELQGQRRTWYCGAWAGYGFHEDGLKSGYVAADHMLRTL
ncbi:MAG: NAD(P)-binding protein [Burkholderiales bacterium]|jgi:predicted NAD/FAD-binding protein|nr:NAD(P)-binding protein [Burkholderiales bacterium]MCA3162365.1 NAD(P)-binding protein [Burkholderiales bacterium]MCA3163143.1 NAD(P)-binding protein [Burkholderiales bacterium]MCA3166366.1 NAD(P)-binding protein [Burkholderiales bacterium]MCA3169338.1 NAD(P)-binding protein [Burkholderiales bacterium]